MVNHDRQNKGKPLDTYDDRRKHLRVDTPLKARFLNDAGEEHSCLVTNISAGGAMLRSKTPPPFGSTVVLYIDRMGRFEGQVIRAGVNSFAVNYEKKRAKNAKIADGLTEVLNKGSRSHDRRASPRIKHDTPAVVFFEEGHSAECAIRDISLTGASIAISPRPPLGTRLILGRMTAKVVRRHEKGVGVVFTGAAERIADVITETTEPPTFEPTAGTPVAKPFGKKG